MKKKMFYLGLTTISLIAIFGAITYYFYALNWVGIIITLVLVIISFFIFKKINIFSTSFLLKNWIPAFPKGTPSGRGMTREGIIYHFLYLAFLIITFYLLFTTKTASAITSPWQIVSAKFFIAYFLATVNLILAIIKKSSLSIYLIMVHYFLSFSVLWIIFKIGYGFDPFIHQATLELIDKQGAVEPKTFYYLGQYALETIAHKIFFIKISWLDKLLVPVLAATTIPPAIFLFLKKFLRISTHPTSEYAKGDPLGPATPLTRGDLSTSGDNLAFSIQHLALIFILVLPFSIFILTVPQNLAYLFLILSIFIGLGAKEKFELFLAGFLALATFAIHPIAGIPAVLFTIALFVKNIDCSRKQNRAVPCSYATKIILPIIFVLVAFSLPTAFYLANRSQSDTVAIESPIPSSVKISLASSMPNQENLILNFIQLFSFNQWIWLTILALVGIFISWQKRKENPGLLISTELAIALLIAFLITKNFLNFSYLISYERGDFLERILILTFIFLLPGITLVFFKLIEKISQQNKFIKISWLIFGVLLITTSLYCSYPRKDNYFNSRSFSVGQSDFDAVEWIEKDANRKPYVVLANQQVSVAALKTFGFNRYYKSPLERGVAGPNGSPLAYSETGGVGGEVYFYPIPTGGPLYQIYLKMVYDKPSRANALEATDLTGINTVYFAINKYWWAFDKIVEEAKIEASSFKIINDGEIYIFKYQK